MPEESSVAWSSSSLFEGCIDLLRSADYTRASLPDNVGLPPAAALLEDAYSIVLVVSFDAWEQLSAGWRSAQEALVQVLTTRLSSFDAKSWDGYLILLTPTEVTKAEFEEMISIRYDTDYARKLVITSNEYGVGGSRLPLALAPVLPLELSGSPADVSDPLEGLPEELADDPTTTGFVRALIAAYRNGQPLMDAAHVYIEEERDRLGGSEP
jgi:hypothetical protein